MANSDNTFGTFNKKTSIFGQVGESRTIFTDIETAKSHFFTADALAVWNETCTTIAWDLSPDNNGDLTQLQVTFDFGTKGDPSISEADDWAGQYLSRKTSLQNADNWFVSPAGTFVLDDHSDHLF